MEQERPLELVEEIVKEHLPEILKGLPLSCSIFSFNRHREPASALLESRNCDLRDSRA